MDVGKSSFTCGAAAALTYLHMIFELEIPPHNSTASKKSTPSNEKLHCFTLGGILTMTAGSTLLDGWMDGWMEASINNWFKHYNMIRVCW